MNGTKYWWESRAVWGGVIAIAAPVLNATGRLTVTPADAQQVVDVLTAIAAGVGGLLAVWGRVSATSRIG